VPCTDLHLSARCVLRQACEALAERCDATAKAAHRQLHRHATARRRRVAGQPRAQALQQLQHKLQCSRQAGVECHASVSQGADVRKGSHVQSHSVTNAGERACDSDVRPQRSNDCSSSGAAPPMQRNWFHLHTEARTLALPGDPRRTGGGGAG
jgi:hypothetical protein